MSHPRFYPLTAGMIKDAKLAEKKKLIGQRLFPKIQVMITGMLLEMDNTELLVFDRHSENSFVHKMIGWHSMQKLKLQQSPPICNSIYSDAKHANGWFPNFARLRLNLYKLASK